MKSILKDVGETVWGTDSRLYCTVKDYINPGIYIRNWMNKKQVGYISPVKMFLIINLIYFLLLSLLWYYGLGFNSFVTQFELQIQNQFYSDLIRDASLSLISSSGLEESQFAALYNDRVFAISNSLIIILCFLAAAILYIVNFRKSRLLYHHVSMGLYYGGSLLLIFLAINFILALVILFIAFVTPIPVWLTSDFYLSSILFLFVFLFSLLSQIRMYNEHKVISFVKAVIITFLFVFAGIIFYRFILFWVTFSSVLLFP